MHLPGWLLHNPLTWISGLFQWIGRYYAYLVEIFTAGVLLLGFLIEALSILLNHQSLFWGMFIVLLLFLAFIPASLYLARDGLLPGPTSIPCKKLQSFNQSGGKK